MSGKKRSGRDNVKAKSQSVLSQQPLASQAEQLIDNIKQLMDIGQQEIAINVLPTLLDADPAHPEGLKLQGELLLRRGLTERALESLSVASYQRHDDAKLFLSLAQAHWKLGHDRAAISALSRVVELSPNSAGAMTKLGALYYAVGMRGRGRYWIEKATRKKPVYSEKNKLAKFKVLELRTALSCEWSIKRESFDTALTEGHNNLSSMFDNEKIETIRLFVDYVDEMPELLRKLEKVDVVYNSITDADRCFEALNKAEKVCNKLGLPVINEPKAVLAASREGNYQRFKDNPYVILPKSVKVESAQKDAKTIVEQAMKDHAFELPVIIRLAGFQGGKFMHKVEDLESHDFTELDEKLCIDPQAVYVIQYHDIGYYDNRISGKKLYKKYRAFFVGGELYPAHMLVSDDYNVHWKRAKEIFSCSPELLEDEKRYFDNPAHFLGDAAWQELKLVVHETGLDYVGIDFCISLKEKKIVVFEMNASMENSYNKRSFDDVGCEDWVQHGQKAWGKINNKVHEVLCEKSGFKAWDFAFLV